MAKFNESARADSSKRSGGLKKRMFSAPNFADLDLRRPASEYGLPYTQTSSLDQTNTLVNSVTTNTVSKQRALPGTSVVHGFLTKLALIFTKLSGSLFMNLINVLNMF